MNVYTYVCVCVRMSVEYSIRHYAAGSERTVVKLAEMEKKKKKKKEKSALSGCIYMTPQHYYDTPTCTLPTDLPRYLPAYLPAYLPTDLRTYPKVEKRREGKRRGRVE